MREKWNILLMVIDKWRERVKMKLKENIDFIDFIKKLKTCRGDVYFCTPEGDRLNLKSMLSQYIFSANIQDKSMIRDGWIECEAEEDLNTLEIYKKI